MEHLLQGMYDVDLPGQQFSLRFRLHILESGPNVKEQFLQTFK